MSITRFYNGSILRRHSFIYEDFWIKETKVIAPEKHADVEIDLEGLTIAPGYIDLQINGAFGVDFSSQPEQWQQVAKKLPQYGVTSFLATIVSQSQTKYRSALDQLQPQASSGATLLGIHLEGPLLNPLYAGAHLSQYLSNHLIDDLDGVKLITLAPELFQKTIQRLKDKRIVTSAGHTNATSSETANAEKSGLRAVTHLYNAMRPFHHREPGIIGYTLTQSNLFYSLIVDGLHVHPDAIKLAWKANPTGLFLISDAIEAVGLGEGHFSLGGNPVNVKQGKATLKNHKALAGSLLTLDQAVRNFLKCTKCTPEDAILAASLKPAQMMGMEKYKGHLEIGADADFNILDQNLHVKECYVLGKKR